jgi:RNA polymerase sigma-70 factor (ECF subfamily)
VGDASKDLTALIQGCIRQERESQKRLYQLFYGYAMSVCLRYSRTKEEAVEILNDGFMKVFTKIGRYDASRSFKGWLRRILINTAIDAYRQNYKHYFAEDISVLEHEVVAENVQDQLNYEVLIQLIQELSPAYRAVFNLYVIDGFTHEEIAEQLHISVGTSKSNLSKARANLQGRIKKIVPDEYWKYA